MKLLIMFVLTASIIIGNLKFSEAINVEISKSSQTIFDSATLQMPYLVKIDNAIVELADMIVKGDKVEITLGYEDVYEGVEFTGFVKKITEGEVIEIECEDNIYLLRTKNLQKTWRETTLKDVLNFIVADTDIKLTADIPEVKLKPFYLNDVNGAVALQKIKSDYGFTVYFNSEGHLYAGLAYKENLGTVKYTLPHRKAEKHNVNVISHGLTYQSDEDVKLRIKAIYISPSNKKTEVEVGDKDGELRTLYSYDVSEPKKLKEWAKSEIQKYKYSGYKGNFTAFLIPFCAYGYNAEVFDPQTGRKGVYFVESVRISFGSSGARRVPELGIKVSA